MFVLQQITGGVGYDKRYSSMKQTLRDRFNSKFTKSDGCWEWKAALDFSGYGQIRYGKRMYHASRISWFLETGHLPSSNIFVCHKCDNPKCVRPSHLFLGTQSENQIDSSRKLRHRCARKTHCSRDHEFSLSNTYWSLGQRCCRLCKAESSAKQYLKKKGTPC